MMIKPRDPEIPDPYKEIWDNFDLISPVKKCPQCGKLTLQFNPKTGELYCTNCDFRKSMPRMQ